MITAAHFANIYLDQLCALGALSAGLLLTCRSLMDTTWSVMESSSSANLTSQLQMPRRWHGAAVTTAAQVWLTSTCRQRHQEPPLSHRVCKQRQIPQPHGPYRATNKAPHAALCNALTKRAPLTARHTTPCMKDHSSPSNAPMTRTPRTASHAAPCTQDHSTIVA
jgi:hypothetical protein